jgi:hypothetical protein
MTIPTEENFLSHVSKHSMKVLHDDGLYRHLNFSNNGSFNQQFDIVTWPGFLAYSGDMGCFVFSRVNDMFSFFRNDNDKKELYINPSYWGEKLQSVDRDGYHSGYKEYSPEKFKEQVKYHVNEWIEEYELSEEDAKELKVEIDYQVLSSSDGGEYKAHEALRDFFFHIDGHRFEFSDTWEWDLTDYTYRYIWCCYAIVWSIQQYDNGRK